MKDTPRARSGASEDARRRSAGRSCWMIAQRLFWLGLIAVHGPAVWAIATRLISASSIAEAPIESAIALTATLSFFALKLLDVPLLRVRGRRSQSLALLLTFAIAHHEAIPLHDDTLIDGAAIVITLGGATAEAISRLRRRARHHRLTWKRITLALAAQRARDLLLDSLAWAELVLHRPPAARFALVTAPGRAPPLLSR